MPFKSFAQQSYMFMAHPELAKRWAKKYGTLTKPKNYRPSSKRAIKKRSSKK